MTTGFTEGTPLVGTIGFGSFGCEAYDAHPWRECLGTREFSKVMLENFYLWKTTKLHNRVLSSGGYGGSNGEESLFRVLNRSHPENKRDEIYVSS